MNEPKRPHPKNADGPFYVVEGCCTSCEVPFIEAPGLFAFDDQNHCYVQRQPDSAEDLNRMLRAAWGAEVRCIRYRGRDESVLRRLGELGQADVCDTAPHASIQPTLRNHVTFITVKPQVAPQTQTELATAFQTYLRSRDHWARSIRFTPLVASGNGTAFSFSWSEEFHPLEFLEINLPHARWLIRHSPLAQLGSWSVSFLLNDWLRDDECFGEFRWYTEAQWNTSREWQELPW